MASLHSRKEVYPFFYAFYLFTAAALLHEPWHFQERNATKPTGHSIVCDNLFLGHLIIISVNAFYYAVCVLMSLPFFVILQMICSL